MEHFSFIRLFRKKSKSYLTVKLARSLTIDDIQLYITSHYSTWNFVEAFYSESEISEIDV